MKIWLDDLRKMPEEFTHHAYSVNEAKQYISSAESDGETDLISNYVSYGKSCWTSKYAENER